METPDDARNKLCRPCPHPNEPKDYLPAVLITLCNFLRCAGAFPRFVNSSRLFIAYHDSLLYKLRQAAKNRHLFKPAIKNLQKLHAKHCDPAAIAGVRFPKPPGRPGGRSLWLALAVVVLLLATCAHLFTMGARLR